MAALTYGQCLNFVNAVYFMNEIGEDGHQPPITVYTQSLDFRSTVAYILSFEIPGSPYPHFGFASGPMNIA